MSVLPLYGILAIDVVTALVAVGPLLVVRIPRPPRREGASVRAGGPAWLWQDVREGLRYIWRWPALCWVMVMATLINFFLNPAYSLMPLLVTKHFGGEAQQLGWISSVGGVGVVLGGLLLSVWGGFRRRYVTGMMGLVGMGLGTLLTGLAPQTAFGLALAATLLARLMNPIANGPLFAILQSSVEPEMQGRVFTLVGSLAGAITPLAMAIAGPVSDALGVRAWFLVDGAVCMAMGLAGFVLPAIAALEQGRPTEAAPATSLAAE